MVRTIRQTQEFGPITASNDEKVSIPVVLLLCVQISLPRDLYAAVLRAGLEKPVLFEALGRVISHARLGGLHHRYDRAA